MGALRPHPRGSGIPGPAHRAARALRPARSPDARRRGRPRPFHRAAPPPRRPRGRRRSLGQAARAESGDCRSAGLRLQCRGLASVGYLRSWGVGRDELRRRRRLRWTLQLRVRASGQGAGECVRVLRPGGYLLLSVMSLWGTLHRHRAALRDMPRAAMRTIIATGDLTAETDPTSRHYCHMYRAAELRAFLAKPGLEVEQISASSALATGVENEFITAPEQWEALLEYEATACDEPGYCDAGTHLLAVVRRDSPAA